MKSILRVFIFFLVFFFVSKGIMAQYDGMRFGLKAEPSIAWFVPESKDLQNNGSKMEFCYGLIAEFPFTDNAAFTTGFEIVNAGGKVEYDVSPENPYYVEELDTFDIFSRKYKIRYANIPLGLKFKTNEIGYMMFFGKFGVDAGFKVKSFAEDEGKFRLSQDIDNSNVDVSDDVNFIRLGLNIGAGVEYYISGNTHLLVGIDFNNGFTNVLEKESYNIIDKDGEKLKQNTIGNYIGLNVGILF